MVQARARQRHLPRRPAHPTPDPHPSIPILFTERRRHAEDRTRRFLAGVQGRSRAELTPQPSQSDFRPVRAWRYPRPIPPFRRRKLDASSPPNVLILGEDLVRGFEDPGRAPTQADLESVIGAATSVAVRAVWSSGEVLYETDDPSELASLRDALRIEGVMGHCMCPGTLAFRFRGEGEDFGTVTLHHGESLRWDPFFENAPLVDSDPILDWLSAHGMPDCRQEYDDSRRRREADDEAAARWHAAVPPALESLWPSMSAPSGEWPEVADVMSREYPDPVERARILFEWFGHGEGPWSGYPSYESVPEWCLLQMPLDVLLEAARGEPQTESLREGAARLFAGWHFRKQRARDLRRIPRDLKLHLLEHTLRSSDEGKLAWARRAFGGKLD